MNPNRVCPQCGESKNEHEQLCNFCTENEEVEMFSGPLFPAGDTDDADI